MERKYPSIFIDRLYIWFIIPTIGISYTSIHFVWLCYDIYFQWKKKITKQRRNKVWK